MVADHYLTVRQWHPVFIQLKRSLCGSDFQVWQWSIMIKGSYWQGSEGGHDDVNWHSWKLYQDLCGNRSYDAINIEVQGEESTPNSTYVRVSIKIVSKCGQYGIRRRYVLIINNIWGHINIFSYFQNIIKQNLSISFVLLIINNKFIIFFQHCILLS